MTILMARGNPMGKSIARQRGEGLSGLLTGCVVVLALAMFGLRVFPMVKEKLEVDSAMESVAQTSGTGTTKEDLINRLLRQFAVANITHFTPTTLMTELKVGSVSGRAGRMMMLSYDMKVPLFGNLYLGFTYSKTVRLPGDAE